MKAVGLIVEYNPFHNGHAFHLQASKEAAGADVVIAVMSGNFLQRGEPALVSKWYRTQMALLNGVDLVFELPYRFAVQKAETFASGAVSILDATGCEALCFGSESGDLTSFLQTISFLKENQQLFDASIKQHMENGVSYPKAIALSYQGLSGSDQFLNLAKPNNILGFQYMKAILEQNSQLKPLTVARKNADYHDEHFASETIASATSIRKAIFSEEEMHSPNIEQYVPEPTNRLLQEYKQRFGSYHHWENYWDLLQYKLITSSADELKNIYEMEEGLENRLVDAALTSADFKEYMDNIKTKRYTWTRLQRLSVHVLTNAKKTDMKNSVQAEYLRLLGMTQTGKDYLNKMKKHFSLPIISKLSAFKEKEILLDIKATRIYAMAFQKHIRKQMIRQEFNQPPIFIQKRLGQNP
ncbi:nucleotidyltransferase, partial [Neobacillus mesonae]|uniref:nucleotidyltransferase n=1 Tax=Neobacillus mesonae TaxID=1193713 RepID=UPI002E1CADDA|nr:nucleotidyltransferase [Neobacillus mesonae]